MGGAGSVILTIGIWDRKETYEQILLFVNKLGPEIKKHLRFLYFSEEEMLYHNITDFDILVADYQLISAGDVMKRIKAQGIKSVRKLVIVSEKIAAYKYAYNNGAFLFLLKPLAVDDLYELVSDVLVSNVKDSLVRVRGEAGDEKIEQKDILFIEANRSSTLVYTKDEVYRSSVSLAKWKEVLNPKLFIRCHRSYIVNKTRIERVEQDECILSTGERVLITKSFRKGLI